MIFEVKELGSVHVKGQDKKKRDIVVADDTNQGISLTLWEQEAERSLRQGQIIRIEGVLVSEFKGVKQLTSIQNSKISYDTNCPLSQKLNEWKISNNVTLSDI